MSMIGTASYLTSQQGLLNTIYTVLGWVPPMNTMRVSSRQEWLNPPVANGGTVDPYARIFHREYVDYILQNTNLKVIIDPNHVYYTTDGVFDIDGGSQWTFDHWAQIYEWIATLADMYRNNDRVIVETFNEYKDGTGRTPLWTLAQEMVNSLRAQKITNPLLFNKWTQNWTRLIDPLDPAGPGKLWYSYHYYFGGYTGPWSAAGALANLDLALGLGIKICNTEVGANSRGGSNITSAQVAVLNEFLAGCATRRIGNMLWNTNDNQDFGIYRDLGLVIPDIVPEAFCTFTIVDSDFASYTPGAGVYTLTRDTTMTVSVVPAAGYRFGGWLINQTLQSEQSTTINVVLDEDFLTLEAIITSGGNVTVMTNIGAVPLFVDGSSVGNTPRTIQLEEGTHVFEVPPEVIV